MEFGTGEVNLSHAVREKWPHGHENFVKNALEGIELHDRKNQDYAAGGDTLGNFKRISAILALYPGLKPNSPIVVCITYMLKQLDCILIGLSSGQKKIVDSEDERWIDVVVYSQLGRILNQEGDHECSKLES